MCIKHLLALFPAYMKRGDYLTPLSDPSFGQHIAVVGLEGWDLEHSLDCRMDGEMSRCAYHYAMVAWGQRDTGVMVPDVLTYLGRQIIVGIANGMPVFEKEE